MLLKRCSRCLFVLLAVDPSVWLCLLHLFFFSFRAPEPQKPQTKPLDDIVRSNHYDPDEDEEYYRKQLSYFDRRSFDSKAMGQPAPGISRFHDLPKPAQLSYPYHRYCFFTRLENEKLCMSHMYYERLTFHSCKNECRGLEHVFYTFYSFFSFSIKYVNTVQIFFANTLNCCCYAVKRIFQMFSTWKLMDLYELIILKT